MTSRQLTIHIGAHKCGSSSFQELLTEQADALAQQGVRYMLSGRNDSTNHHRLVRTIEASTGRKAQRIPPPAQKKIQASFWEELRESEEERLVISSEAFEHLSGQDDLSFFRKIRREGVSIRTLFFVREHVSLFNSTYVEVVRSLQCLLPVDEYFTSREKYFSSRFSRILRRWERFSDDVVVQEFTPGAMERFVLDQWKVEAKLPHSRAGLSAVQVEAALLYARHFAEGSTAPVLWDHLPFHDHLGEWTGTLGASNGSFWGVDDALGDALLSCAQEDRNYLDSQYGLRLPEPKMKPVNALERPFTSEQVAEIANIVANFVPKQTVDEYLSS